jgi:hypothetical protein
MKFRRDLADDEADEGRRLCPDSDYIERFKELIFLSSASSFTKRLAGCRQFHASIFILLTKNKLIPHLRIQNDDKTNQAGEILLTDQRERDFPMILLFDYSVFDIELALASSEHSSLPNRHRSATEFQQQVSSIQLLSSTSNHLNCNKYVGIKLEVK